MSVDERFFAWLDGELSGPEAVEMEARVRADPALAKLAEQHRQMNQRLKHAFDGLLEDPVPDSMAAAARGPAGEVTELQARTPSAPRAWSGGPGRWMALAATLAAGILVGTLVPRGEDAPIQLRDGEIQAAAGLADALDRQLASAPAAGSVRVGVTFRDQSGTVCRSFTQPNASGVACRKGSGWEVRGLFAAPEGQAAEYRMAAGADPQLAALIGSMIAGEPFDAARERAARENGWR